MPGVSMDGSEDLPYIPDDDRTPVKLGMCPFCFFPATHMAKNPEGTRFCKNGHKWPNYMSLLAMTSSQRSTEPTDPQYTVYGLCPTCGCAGTARARDIEGTTHCKNGHTWKANESKQNVENPVDQKQNSPYDSSQLIEKIKSTVKQSAETARENAGYAGSWGDGGASQMEEKLKHWLDGFRFAQTGQTEVYKHLVDQFKKERDPDYQKWLELKEKFGK